MKPTLIQKMLFGLGVCYVLGCGCAAPFRPPGWICYEMSCSDSQSMEYCSVRTPETLTVNGVVQYRNSDSFDTSQTDPFLALDQ